MRSSADRHGATGAVQTAVMKAVVFNKFGGPEAVEVTNTPRPEPGPGEALIKVRAASINPVDWKVLAGLRGPETAGFPRVLGLECAGTVEDTGNSEAQLRSGSQVIGYSDLARLGAFAEYVVLPEEQIYAKPEDISFAEAACLPIAACTALQALRDLGKISAGKKVLINGASGGVGHFAVQIARIFKAEVTAVCSAHGAVTARRLGAAAVIDRAQQDFTKGKGRYDIIFDAVAKSSFKACEKILSEKGVYISTQPVEPGAGQGYKKAMTVRNAPNAADIAWLAAAIEAGTLTAVIDKAFPLDRAREALAYSRSEKAHGKIVLRIA